MVAGAPAWRSRGRKPAPFDPLAPTSFRQGGRKACHLVERDCAPIERVAQAGAVTATLARSPAKPALAWEPWAGSIIPAWRAEMERVGREGVAVAILSLSASGRAELVVRVDAGEQVVLVLGSERTTRIKDAARAQVWGEGHAWEILADVERQTDGKLANGREDREKRPVGRAATFVEEQDRAPQSAPVLEAQASVERGEAASCVAFSARASGRSPAAPAAGRGGRGPVTLSLYRDKKEYRENTVDSVDTTSPANGSLVALSASSGRIRSGAGSVDSVDNPADLGHDAAHGYGDQSSPPEGLQAQLDGQEAAIGEGGTRRGDPSIPAASVGGRSAPAQAQSFGSGPVARDRVASQGREDGRRAGIEAGAGGDLCGGRSQQAVSVRVRQEGQELHGERGGGRDRNLTHNGRAMNGETTTVTEKATIYDIYCL